MKSKKKDLLCILFYFKLNEGFQKLHICVSFQLLSHRKLGKFGANQGTQKM